MKKLTMAILSFLLFVNLFGCADSNPANASIPTDAIWLSLETAKDVFEAAKQTPKGKVVISDTLAAAMDQYSSDEILAVGICFAAMVADDLSADTDEYKDIFNKARKSFDKAGIPIKFVGGVCEKYRFFYAYATKDQLNKLTCGSSTALYVAAICGYK